MRFDWVTRVSLNNLRPLLSLFSVDLAIDLGTTNTRVYARGRGIVVNEPSAVALDESTGEVQAVGKEAKEMLGRTPGNIIVVKPLKNGVIADFKVTEKMLNYFIQKAHQRKTLVHPCIVISVPSEITQVEQRAVMESAYRAKAAEVHLVEQAMMAAIGAGLPVTEPGGNMVVDIGGGTTDVAVISLSGIVYSRSLRIAGNYMDEAIVNYLKRKYNLLIGERSAEQIKIEIGSAYTLDKPLTMEIKGRSLIEGKPKAITVDDKRDPRGVERVCLDHCERGPGGAGAHPAGAFRGHQRPRHRARGRRRLTEKPGQANPGRNRGAGMHRRRSVVLRGARHQQDAQRLQILAKGFDRIDASARSGSPYGYTFK